MLGSIWCAEVHKTFGGWRLARVTRWTCWPYVLWYFMRFGRKCPSVELAVRAFAVLFNPHTARCICFSG